MTVPSGRPILLLSLTLAGCLQSQSPQPGTSPMDTVQASSFGVVSGGIYRLTDVNSNLALDVDGVSQAAGANVQVWEVNDQANQRWKVEDVGNSYATLKAQHSGKCLDVVQAGTTSGSNVQQAECSGSKAQKFRLVALGDGVFKLLAGTNAALALDVFGGGTSNGTNVQIAIDNRKAAQKWKFTRLDGGTTVPNAESVPNTVQTLVDDMTLPHESRPHGVPDSYDWSQEPRIGMGNDPGKFRALIAWGQLYEAAEGNRAKNTRVQMRDLKTYVLSKADGKWRMVQNSEEVEGAAYVEDFVDDISRPSDLRPESSGGISVTAGGGYNFHFWPRANPSRVSIEPSDIGGVFTTLRARLIVADSSQPDDRNSARYLLSVGADYWLSPEAQWDQFKTNGEVGIGRFRYVGKAWQSFNMTSLSADQLRRSPPPLE